MVDSKRFPRSHDSGNRSRRPRPNKQSPACKQNLANMAGEVEARLMRPGRHAELGLTAEEAYTLGQEYVNHLETAPDAVARAIIEATNHATRENLQRPSQVGGLRLPGERPPGGLVGGWGKLRSEERRV